LAISSINKKPDHSEEQIIYHVSLLYSFTLAIYLHEHMRCKFSYPLHTAKHAKGSENV